MRLKKSQLSIRNTILKYRKIKPLQKYSLTDVFVASNPKKDVFQIYKMYKQFLKISVRENHKAIKKFLCYVNIIYFFLLSEGIKKIKIFLESGTEEFERVYIKKLDLFIISENFCFERIEKNSNFLLS